MLLLERRLNQVNLVQEVEAFFLYGPDRLLIALHPADSRGSGRVGVGVLNRRGRTDRSPETSPLQTRRAPQTRNPPHFWFGFLARGYSVCCCCVGVARMAGGSSAETLSMNGSVSVAEQQQRHAAAAAVAKVVPSLVCVECGRPVALLFREYNKGNIRLGRCVSARCCTREKAGSGFA